MKALLPWFIVVLAIAAAGVLYQGNHTKSVELAKLQSSVQELEALRSENEELKNQIVPAEELARLRQDKLDLLRLRNEIRQVRDDKKQLAQQAQSALSEAQRAQAQAHAAQVQVQSLSTNLEAVQAATTAEQRLKAFAARYGLTLTPEQAALSTCINHLRQLDGAKQQWALENKKTAEATPTTQDLMPYLKDNLWPVCPGGGNYTIGAVSAVPTCSMPSHSLPQQ
ncbi:MAG: hypothetical protein V9H26_19580 [Verrucomicrobiota bacterium]